MRFRRSIAVLTLASGLLLGPAAYAPAQSAPPVPGFEDDALAARAGALELRWKDLDELLLLRHAMTRAGREALRHLAETRIVETAAREAGLEVAEAAVDARYRELERKWSTSGQGVPFEKTIQNARLTEAEFRYFLRTGMLQEELTRRALGLAAGAEISPDQTRLWMQEACTERSYSEFPPPWADGVVASASGVRVLVHDFVVYLRRRLEPEELRTDCYQLLLHRRVRERLPDVAPARVDEYVRNEIERRRREAAADPRNKGLPFEKLLAAQGIAFESLPRDPGVVVSALSKLWVDRAYDAETLKRTYQDERELYDGQFGEAIEVWMLFLRAAQFKNEFNPRSFAEAEAELGRLAAGLRTREEFQKAVQKASEDASTRENGGELGWITAGSRGAPPEVRAEVKRRLALPPTPAQAAGEGLAGPLRTSTGCVLLWLGPRRSAPTWELMAGYVQRELRRRFLEEALPRASVIYSFGNP